MPWLIFTWVERRQEKQFHLPKVIFHKMKLFGQYCVAGKKRFQRLEVGICACAVKKMTPEQEQVSFVYLFRFAFYRSDDLTHGDEMANGKRQTRGDGGKWQNNNFTFACVAFVRRHEQRKNNFAIRFESSDLMNNVSFALAYAYCCSQHIIIQIRWRHRFSCCYTSACSRCRRRRRCRLAKRCVKKGGMRLREQFFLPPTTMNKTPHKTRTILFATKEISP